MDNHDQAETKPLGPPEGKAVEDAGVGGQVAAGGAGDAGRAGEAGVTRRQVLATGLAAAAGAMWAGHGGAGAKAHASDAQPGGGQSDVARVASRQPGRGRRARGVIFLVSDGMSMGVPSLAEPFAQLVRGRGTRWFELLRESDAVHGYYETHAADSLVTDSAAAASAWSCGSRVNNGAINMLPDGSPGEPLGWTVKRQGGRVGLVTTTTATHATPAGFAARGAGRNAERLFAAQYLEHRMDVILGGGKPFFESEEAAAAATASGGAAEGTAPSQDLLGQFGAAGYQVVYDRDALLAAKLSSPLLGLFGPSHLPYTLDQRTDASLMAQVPTLGEMTDRALANLTRDNQPFFLMVEGGRVDHAAHANDSAGLLWDQLAFDDAAGVALDWAQRLGDVLVVLTSDHGNSNPGLNGMGRRTDEFFGRLTSATQSFSWIWDRWREAGTLSDEAVRALIHGARGIELNDDEVAMLQKVVKERGRAGISPWVQHRSPTAVLGLLLGNHTGVTFNSVSHTADLVPITAIGPGAAAFAGLRRNTDARGDILRAMGIAQG